MSHPLSSEDLDTSGGAAAHFPRVLLASESSDEREMYAEAFRLYGFCTLQAETAADAYWMASELSPALVITDVQLSGAEDGLALTRRVKNDPLLGGIPVVVLTAYVLEGDRERAESSGCDLLLSKPCLPDALSRMAGDLISGRPVRDDGSSRMVGLEDAHASSILHWSRRARGRE